jgi:hypothetical protein
MDNKIKSILEDAGWYPGREIEIGYMVEELVEHCNLYNLSTINRSDI